MQFVGSPGCEFGRGSEIGDRDGGGVGCDDSRNAETQCDGEERTAEANQSLKDKIAAETVEALGTLDVASARPEGNVKRYANREQDHEKGSGQLEVVRDCLLKQQQ